MVWGGKKKSQKIGLEGVVIIQERRDGGWDCRGVRGTVRRGQI